MSPDAGRRGASSDREVLPLGRQAQNGVQSFLTEIDVGEGTENYIN